MQEKEITRKLLMCKCRTEKNDGWMDGQMDGWMDGWMDEWKGGWLDGLIDVFFSRNPGETILIEYFHVCGV